MSRVAVLGASGRLGSELVLRALQTGLSVNAFARDPKKVRHFNERLTVYQGDAATGAGLAAAVRGCAFVVSTLDSNEPVMSSALGHLLSVVKHPPLQRLVLVSRLGVGDSAGQVAQISGLLAPLAPKVQRPLYADLSKAEGLLRTSKVPWSLLRPTWLTDDVPSGEVVAVDAHAEPPSRISRAALARFIITVLEDPAWVGREATVGTKRTDS